VALHSALGAQRFEVKEGALVVATVADFVAVEALEGEGVVAERGECEGGVHGGDLSVFVVGNGVIGTLLGVDGVGVLDHFKTPEAAAAPVGDGHDLDEAGFAGGFGLELVKELGEKGGEASVGLAGEDDGLGEYGVAGGVLGGAGFTLWSDCSVGVDGVGGGGGFSDGRDRSAGFGAVGARGGGAALGGGTGGDYGLCGRVFSAG